MKHFLICLTALGLLGGATTSAEADPTWARIAPFFHPPAEFAGKFGSYASPLKFYDGRPVRDAAEWPQRRQEILDRWHGLLGPWPPLIERPMNNLKDRISV